MPGSLEDLPNEIILHLAKFLDKKSLKKMHKLNRRLYGLLLSNRNRLIRPNYRTFSLEQGQRRATWRREFIKEEQPSPLKITFCLSQSKREYVLYFDELSKIAHWNLEVIEYDQRFALLPNEKIVCVRTNDRTKIFIYSKNIVESVKAHLKHRLSYAIVEKMELNKLAIIDNLCDVITPVILSRPQLDIRSFIMNSCELHNLTLDAWGNLFDSICPRELVITGLTSNNRELAREYLGRQFWEMRGVKALESLNLVSKRTDPQFVLRRPVNTSDRYLDMQNIPASCSLGEDYMVGYDTIIHILKEWLHGQVEINKWRFHIEEHARINLMNWWMLQVGASRDEDGYLHRWLSEEQFLDNERGEKIKCKHHKRYTVIERVA